MGNKDDILHRITSIIQETTFFDFPFLINQMIISKNPQFTGKIRGLQAEFTTNLLLYGKALICC